MNRTLQAILVLICLLVVLSLSGCYDAGYKKTDSTGAIDRLGELSDEFDEDIKNINIPTEEPSPIATDSDDLSDNSETDETNNREVEETESYEHDESDKAETLEELENIEGSDETDRNKTTTIKAQQTSTPSVTVTEGEIVNVGVAGSDPDGDNVEYTFSFPLDKSGAWKTTRGDAGIYEAYITATDGDKSLTKSVVIEVLKANDAPVIDVTDEITVFEGETIKLDVTVSDLDPADEPSYTISGWMQTLSKKTNFDDAGEYTLTITATDGKDSVSKDITIIVKNVNRAPEFEIVLG